MTGSGYGIVGLRIERWGLLGWEEWCVGLLVAFASKKREREREGGGEGREWKRHRGRITKEYLNEVVKKNKIFNVVCIIK